MELYRKNKLRDLTRRLLTGVLILTLLLGLNAVSALTAFAAEDFFVQVDVSISRETKDGVEAGAEPKDGPGKVKIEGCDYVEPRGVPDGEKLADGWDKKNGSLLMPNETSPLTVPAAGASFTWNISDSEVVPGEMYSYKITQVPGSTSSMKYDDNEYILEIYIFQVDPADEKSLYAFAQLRDDDAPLNEDDDENIYANRKPDSCDFLNKKTYSVVYRDGKDPGGEYHRDDDIPLGEEEPEKPEGPEDPTGRGRKFKEWKKVKVYTDDDGDVTEIIYEPVWLEPPTGNETETWGKKNETQNSDEGNNGPLKFTQGDGEFTKIELLDKDGNPVEPDDKGIIKTPAYDSKGNQVGTYTMTSADPKTGEVTVIFTPNKDYVGDVEPCYVQATDEYGYIATCEYKPHITDDDVVPPKAKGDETTGKRGEKQTGTVEFTEGSGEIVKVELIDPHTGKPAEPDENGVYTVDALDKDGNVVGTYTLDPKTRKVNEDGTITYDVVFTPKDDFVGTPLPAEIRATDVNGLTATALYQPHVTDEPAPTKTPTPTTTPKPTSTPSKASQALSKSVKTGDDFNPLPYILGIGGGIVVLALIIAAVRKRRRDDDE